MKPDPTTKEGQEEIKKIFERRKKEAEAARKRSEQDVEEEPAGKLTIPNEIDIRKDRRNRDERKE